MSSPSCTWCRAIIEDEDVLQHFNCGHEQEVFCCSDCLFHQLLSDRTDTDTYYKILELLHQGSISKR